MSHNKITTDELAKIFGDRLPMDAVRVMREEMDHWRMRDQLQAIAAAQPGVATVRLTSSGPVLSVFDIEVRAWLGTAYNTEALGIAVRINQSAKAR